MAMLGKKSEQSTLPGRGEDVARRPPVGAPLLRAHLNDTHKR